MEMRRRWSGFETHVPCAGLRDGSKFPRIPQWNPPDCAPDPSGTECDWSSAVSGLSAAKSAAAHGRLVGRIGRRARAVWMAASR